MTSSPSTLLAMTQARPRDVYDNEYACNRDWGLRKIAVVGPQFYNRMAADLHVRVLVWTKSLSL